MLLKLTVSAGLPCWMVPEAPLTVSVTLSLAADQSAVSVLTPPPPSMEATPSPRVIARLSSPGPPPNGSPNVWSENCSCSTLVRVSVPSGEPDLRSVTVVTPAVVTTE